MGQRVLADKKIKLTILTEKPVDEAHPTIVELNDGIEACRKVLYDGYRFSAADSGTQSGKMLGGANAEVYTDENFVLDFTLARQYLAAGGADPTADVLFEAVKERGVTLWAYGRFTDKPAVDPWVAGDECYLGARFIVDHLQMPDSPAWVSWHVPAKVQEGWTFITVGA